MALPSSKCGECPLSPRLHWFVPAAKPTVEPKGLKVAFVAEAPGEDEATAIKKYPLIGPSGKFWDAMMASAKSNRYESTVTNVLKCWPRNNKLPTDEDLAKAIDCCSEILEGDVREADLIVGMGNLPLRAFLGLDKITLRRGSVFTLPDGRPYLAVLHPSHVMRAEHAKDEEKGEKVLPKEISITDLKRAKKIADGADWRVPENFILEPSVQDWENFIALLDSGRYPYATIDIEAPMRHPLTVVPIIIAITVGDPRVPKDCITIVGDFEIDWHLDWIWLALASAIAKNTQNGMYDVMVLENVGFRVVNWRHDVNYKHHLRYPELPHDLGFIMSVHTWMPYHKDLKRYVDIVTEDLEGEWDK